MEISKSDTSVWKSDTITQEKVLCCLDPKPLQDYNETLNMAR